MEHLRRFQTLKIHVTAQSWKTEPSEEGEIRWQQGKAESTSSILNKLIVKQSLFGLFYSYVF